MSILKKLIINKKESILSVYFTAGFPKLKDTVPIIKNLEQSGVDFIEVGFPFSDPLADGPIIQNSSIKAIENGMTLKLLLRQLETVKDEVDLPLVLMGYMNPILQFGIPEFLEKIKSIGVAGLIIPDMPKEFYQLHIKDFCDQNNIDNILLVTPQTDEKRVIEKGRETGGFLYVVSSNSITGKSMDVDQQQKYFERLKKLNLPSPLIAGFGIHDAVSFHKATINCKGAIIGSAFIRHIEAEGTSLNSIKKFIKNIKP